MKICLISVEIFAWGKYGGFGRATRIIGRELARRGHDVFAVVPRRHGQMSVEDLDGIKVLSFPPGRPWQAKRLFRQIDADIYHSCEPSLGSYLAMRALPHRKHMVTFRDPRDLTDWKMEFARPSLNRWQVLHNFLYENNILVRRSIKQMDAVYTIAKCLVPKVKRMYGLDRDPVFLPTPVTVPDKIVKSDKPTICYLARLDRRKRPEIFLDLARAFPEMEFIMMGQSRDPKWEAHLRKQAGRIPNLEMTGFVDQFNSSRHGEILSKSWVMVNPATREALPNAFIEAASYQCAILSFVDPDGFASKFGYHAGEVDFEKGLAELTKNGLWRERGLAGRRYIEETFEMTRAVDRHLEAYHAVLGSTARTAPTAPRTPAPSLKSRVDVP